MDHASHLLLWFALTLVFNAGATFYISIVRDPVTPCSLSLIFSAAAYWLVRASKCNVEGSSSSWASWNRLSSAPDFADEGPTIVVWQLLLGLLNVLSTILGVSSYALSSVSWTYVFRTVEPLCTAVFQFLVFGQTCTTVELCLLLLVVGSVATVAMPGPAAIQPAQQSNYQSECHRKTLNKPKCFCCCQCCPWEAAIKGRRWSSRAT